MALALPTEKRNRERDSAVFIILENVRRKVEASQAKALP